MPTPDELMRLMAGGPGKTGAAAPPSQPPAAASSPVGSPMTTPQPNEGEQQSAMVNVSMALDLLEQAIGIFGTETPRGQAVYKALGILSKDFSKDRQKAEGLQKAELMQLMSSLPQGGGATPEMQAMQKAA